jgi:hypothetical protein
MAKKKKKSENTGIYVFGGIIISFVILSVPLFFSNHKNLESTMNNKLQEKMVIEQLKQENDSLKQIIMTQGSEPDRHR